MKQEDKNKISREKILKAAVKEFGTKSYENASLNDICSGSGTSKGLIYHYFKSKDEIFLCCVKECFDALTGYLSSKDREAEADGWEIGLQEYLDLRLRFFRGNPLYNNIFFNTVLQPPLQLKDEIKALRSNFDALNTSHNRNAISRLKLREGITEEEAIEYFRIFQEMFNGYFQNKLIEGSDFSALVEAHEIKLGKLLNIMLYGIACDANAFDASACDAIESDANASDTKEKEKE
jgi:AcrR family transcriptional regulator